MTTLTDPVRVDEAATVDGYRHPGPSPRLVAGPHPGSGELAACYETCRRLNAAHGRTYYFASRFLPARRRPHVHALYAFARYTDDLVDHLALGWGLQDRRAALVAWRHQLVDALGAPEETSASAHPVLRALAHTVATLSIPHEDLTAFVDSMEMDLAVARYDTFEQLHHYMHGSAAVIGTMMLPVLGARDPRARPPAMHLGVAFQLTNFLRDVGEDWDRGRVYLPLEDLDRFGVTDWDLHSRHVSPRLRRLLAFEAQRARGFYRRAEEGWAWLPSWSRRCVRIAHRLYGGILDDLEAGGFQVFARRASVPPARRTAIALRELGLPSRPGAAHLP